MAACWIFRRAVYRWTLSSTKQKIASHNNQKKHHTKLLIIKENKHFHSEVDDSVTASEVSESEVGSDSDDVFVPSSIKKLHISATGIAITKLDRIGFQPCALIWAASLSALAQLQKSTATVMIPRIDIASSRSGRGCEHNAPACPRAIRNPISRSDAGV
jgi:hypothetical protein